MTAPLPLIPIPIFNPALIVGVTALRDLLLVETEVNKILETLGEQIEVIKDQKFTSDGSIPASSFGQGTESTRLAKEHTRAHGVIVKSLEDMQTDLLTFQEAIDLAKKAIGGADEQAETDLRILLARAGDLDLGWYGDEPPPVPASDDSTDGTGGEA
ncbi:hypothetical protein [Nocardioides humi]|uniref:Uncharacterized protein n=1 Tax=Nocardioides humi TaxID=449461 RepID=A0ABN1ZRI3_9ACTN|nr:hypothetical protein [Nocardioides humi]